MSSPVDFGTRVLLRLQRENHEELIAARQLPADESEADRQQRLERIESLELRGISIREKLQQAGHRG